MGVNEVVQFVGLQDYRFPNEACRHQLFAPHRISPAWIDDYTSTHLYSRHSTRFATHCSKYSSSISTSSGVMVRRCFMYSIKLRVGVSVHFRKFFYFTHGGLFQNHFLASQVHDTGLHVNGVDIKFQVFVIFDIRIHVFLKTIHSFKSRLTALRNSCCFACM